MDEELRKRISSLAAYVRRNGKDFESLLKSRHQDDPKYTFLFGGLGSEHYISLLNEVDASQDRGRGSAQYEAGTSEPCAEMQSYPWNSKNGLEKHRQPGSGNVETTPDYSLVYSSSCPVGIIPALFAQSKGGSITAQDIEREMQRSENIQEDKDLTRKLRNFYSDLHEHLCAVSARLESRENSQLAERNGKGKDTNTNPSARAKGNPPRKGRRELGRQRPFDSKHADDLESNSGVVLGLVGDRAGLGAQAEATDLYAAYRQKRSGAYHQRIVGSGKKKKKFRRH